MPKRARLTHADMASLRGARRLHGRYVSLTIGPAVGQTARATCVVSKKVSPKAVVRNRIKRRCRAILSPFMHALSPGALVITAKPAAVGASSGELRADIETLLTRADIHGPHGTVQSAA